MSTKILSGIVIWGGLSLLAATLWSCVGMARNNARVRAARRDRESIARATHRSQDAITGMQVETGWRFNAQMFQHSPHPVYDQLAAERDDVVLPELDDLNDESIQRWLA